MYMSGHWVVLYKNSILYVGQKSKMQDKVLANYPFGKIVLKLTPDGNLAGMYLSKVRFCHGSWLTAADQFY